MSVDLQEDPMNTFRSREVLGPSIEPGMVSFLMKKGIVKSEKAAGLVLIVVIILALAGIAYITVFKPFEPKFVAPTNITPPLPGQIL